MGSAMNECYASAAAPSTGWCRHHLPSGRAVRQHGRMDLLRTAADHAISFATSIDQRDATPTDEAIAALDGFDEDLPATGHDAAATIDLLASVGGPAAMGSAGPHYYGFVNGATYPAALAASF